MVRALEVTIGSGRPFSSFGPGLGATPATDFALVGLHVELADCAARIAARYRAQLDGGFLDEVEALAARPAGLARTARQALGYKELLDHLDGACTLDEAVDLAVRRTRQFARRQRAWFRRDPRITWCRRTRRPTTCRSCSTARQNEGRMRLTKHHGLGNDFLVLVDRPRCPTPTWPGASCDRHRGIGADGLLYLSALSGDEPDGAEVAMVLLNADGGRAEMSGNGIGCLAQAGSSTAACRPRCSHAPTSGCGR